MIASDMRYHKELYTVTSRGQIQKSFKEFKLPRVVEKNGKNDKCRKQGAALLVVCQLPVIAADR